MLKKSQIRKILFIEFKIVLGVVLIILLSLDFFRIHIKPSLMQYVHTHRVFLEYLTFGIFLISGLILTYIAWWAECGRKRKDLPVSSYISQLVCENYYGETKKINVYKAIKTSLSKFSRGVTEEAETRDDKLLKANRKIYQRKRFVLKRNSPPDSVTPTVTDASDGVHKTYYKNGHLEKEITYKNNKQDGVYRTYYEDGRLHQEKYYKDGKLDGVFKAYDDEGVLYFEISYKEGVQDGITNSYNKVGILQYRDIYKEGKMVHRDTYSEAGELLFSQDYL